MTDQKHGGKDPSGTEREQSVTYLLHDEDKFKTEKGLFSKKEAHTWAQGENLFERCDEIEIEPLD